MPGTFRGLTDMQWELIKPLIPRRICKVGRPPPDFRKILNTILYVNITGCRWCDIPIGPDWAKRSTAHDWLGILMERNALDRIRHAILCMADLAKLIDWEKGAVDGSFSPWERRGRSH